MSTSLAKSSLGGRAVVVPLIRCPQCRTRVKFYLSNTEKHEGWVFYKCIHHGDTYDFSHWELEYVAYLVDKHLLVGNDAVDAIGAAKDRREELIRGRNERVRNRGFAATMDERPNLGGVAARLHGREQAWVAGSMTKQQAEALLGLGNEMLMVLKAMMATVIVLCLLLALSILKK